MNAPVSRPVNGPVGKPTTARMRAIEFSIAWRYLRSRRGSKLLSLISVIAIGGVLVGVSALIVIMGVMNGLQRDLREKILVGSPDVYILPYGENLRLGGWRDLQERASRVPGVVAVAPFVQTQTLLRKISSTFATGAQVVGITSDTADRAVVTSIRSQAILGDFSFRRENVSLPGVSVGKLLASKLNLMPGDSVVMFGAEINASTGAILPRPDTFVVSGLFETGMFEYDNSRVYIGLGAAQRFAALGEDVTGIELRTRDRWIASDVADSLEVALQDAPVRTEDWQETNRSLFQALQLEKLGMRVILALIMFVAAFNIVSTLTMVVTDKTREIGILRAMGMSARSIRRIFLIQGIIIGAVGTLGGVVLGLVVSYVIDEYHLISLDPSVYFIDHLPVATELGDVLITMLMSLVVAAIATLYPALQAARLYPVDAIRHE